MSFDLKVSLAQRAEQSPQQKKLNRLIDKIEQQKINLKTWQNAQAEIQQHTRQKLLPVYAELHTVLFQQLEQLWNMLHSHQFSKAQAQQLDDKIASLANILKHSKSLSAEQHTQIAKIHTFYQQVIAQSAHKKDKKPQHVSAEHQEIPQQDELEIEQDFEQYAVEQQQAREHAKQQRQQQKREQAAQMAAQSLKTVYLKIAAMIHPDREQDETKKQEKTELFQQASQAYEKQDLFYLLKLQLQLEQNKVKTKELSAEQLRFYKLALDVQSQQLESQIADILDSFQLAKNVKAEHVHISDVYKAIDADAAELKQQLKWEKERLKHMKKVSGVEMLLGHGAL